MFVFKECYAYTDQHIPQKYLTNEAPLVDDIQSKNKGLLAWSNTLGINLGTLASYGYPWFIHFSNVLSPLTALDNFVSWYSYANLVLVVKSIENVFAPNVSFIKVGPNTLKEKSLGVICINHFHFLWNNYLSNIRPSLLRRKVTQNFLQPNYAKYNL